MNGECVARQQPQRETQVQTGLNNLRSRLAVLEKEIECLETALSPILRPKVSSIMGRNKQVESPVPVTLLAPLAEEIESLGKRVEMCQDNLKFIISRLEVS